MEHRDFYLKIFLSQNRPRCRRRRQSPDHVFLSIFGRTDLIIGGSKAKNCADVYFEVRLPLDPPNLAKTSQKRFPTPKNSPGKKKIGRKLKCWGSSETRFGQVPGQSEPSSGGKRTFKVRNFFSDKKKSTSKNETSGIT